MEELHSDRALPLAASTVAPLSQCEACAGFEGLGELMHNQAVKMDQDNRLAYVLQMISDLLQVNWDGKCGMRA
jgi:hypothetical protein